MKKIEEIIKHTPAPKDFGVDCDKYEQEKVRLKKLQGELCDARILKVGNQIDEDMVYLLMFIIGLTGLAFPPLWIVVVVIFVVLKVRNAGYENRINEFHESHKREYEIINEIKKFISSQDQKYLEYKNACREFAIKVLRNYKAQHLHNVRRSQPNFFRKLDYFEDLLKFFENTEPFEITYWNDEYKSDIIKEFKRYIQKRREGSARTRPHRSFENIAKQLESAEDTKQASVDKSKETNADVVLGMSRQRQAIFESAPELNTMQSNNLIFKNPSEMSQGVQNISDKRRGDIGLTGEKVVVDKEIAELIRQGKHDLAEKVTHVSKTRGDGLGYDIKSYFPDGRRKYIEVKSAASRQHKSIILTKNELGLLKRKGKNAFVYLVENAESDNPAIKACPGEVFLNTDKYLVTKYAANMKESSKNSE